MNRDEHLEFCKQRALKYLDSGDILGAITSMGSDLTKHPETKAPDFLMLLGGSDRVEQ